MSKPVKPADVYVNNGWYLNLPVPGVGTNGLFETLAGLNKSTGVVEVVDAGTNRKYKFNDQIIDFGEITLTRPYNGTAADRALEVCVQTMIETGLKLEGVTAIKMHWGKEVFAFVFEGFAFSAMQMPDMDVAGTEKYTVTYTAHCDNWYILPVGK